ncbi:4'-phosphopantetheinyl transferase family protein [Micromonospora sp. LOL_024]|uniref:4'-phosphopantetheinyl transferase family protein n=1 Tax=Micromonospora sp. LOL_024 TaxID=3345412 RepID=UPI003A842620
MGLDDVVHVWRIPLLGVPPGDPDPERLLDPGERRRADRLGDARLRRRYVHAHGTSRLILGGYLGLPPREVTWCRGQHGKPALAGRPEVKFNLSHSADLALLAITRSRETGVDVENLARQDPGAALPADRLAGRFYPPTEATRVGRARGPALDWWYLRLWTRKEACVKASGGRLVQGLPVRVGAGQPAHGYGLRCSGEAGMPGPWVVRDVSLGDGHVAAVALTGTTEYRVVVRTWLGLRRFGLDQPLPERDRHREGAVR